LSVLNNSNLLSPVIHFLKYVLAKKNNSPFVRNIWVSGLSSITKATDLKQLFSKYGKVILLITDILIIIT